MAMDEDFLKYLQGASAGFQKYSAGSKRYGASGRDAPNIGPVGASGAAGYAERDRLNQAKRNAMLRRLKAGQSGRYMSSDWLRK